MRKVRAGSGWRWVRHGVWRAWHGPRAVHGGALMIVLAVMLGSAAQTAAGLTLGPMGEAIGFLISLAFGVGVYPLLFGGFLRVLHAVERGQAASSGLVFDAFRPGHGAATLIGVQVLLTLLSIVVLAAIIAIGGGKGAVAWYMEIAAATPADTLPPAPPGLPWAVGAMVVAGLLLTTVNAIALGQAALGERWAGGAMRDGLVGLWRNLPAAFVFAVSLMALWLGCMLVFAAAVSAATLLPGPLMALLMLLFVLALLVLVFFLLIAMLAAMYALWRDVAGPEDATGAGDIPGGNAETGVVVA